MRMCASISSSSSLFFCHHLIAFLLGRHPERSDQRERSRRACPERSRRNPREQSSCESLQSNDPLSFAPQTRVPQVREANLGGLAPFAQARNPGCPILSRSLPKGWESTNLTQPPSPAHHQSP